MQKERRNMSSKLLGWGGLVILLCFSTFGWKGCATILLSTAAFFIGVFALLLLKAEGITQKYSVDMCRSRLELPQVGVRKVADLVKQPPKIYRVDRRLTGSSIIDEPLQEILSYIFRDYVQIWYSLISSDQDFVHELRQSAQKVVITFANRTKEVDWIPYLTHKLVDDVASHLRLFKQARVKWKERNQDPDAKHVDLESIFFDMEVNMEDNLCRDLVSTLDASEREYLQDLSEVLLFLLLPAEDFHNKPMRYIIRELLVNIVFLPTIQLFSDPDYINQYIIWLCKDVPVTNEVFMTVLRITDKVEELHATREMVCKEIALLRSRDSGGEDDAVIKQQLNSLLYVRKVIDNKVHRLQDGSDTDSVGLPSQIDWNRLLTPGYRLFSLPLDVVLKNNIALSYFLDYMTNIGAQAYLFFYLNIEGWRVSAEQQISAMELDKIKVERRSRSGSSISSAEQQVKENMKEAAYSIYEQYLSDKASPRLKLDDIIVKRLLFCLRTESPCETLFDEVQGAVYDKLQQEERFLPSFRKSVPYVKLLAELDLLKDPSRSDDDEDSRSLDEISLCDNISLSSFDIEDKVEKGDKVNEVITEGSPSGGTGVGGAPSTGSGSSIENGSISQNMNTSQQVTASSSHSPQSKNKLTAASVSVTQTRSHQAGSSSPSLPPKSYTYSASDYLYDSRDQGCTLHVEIIHTGIAKESGKSYAVYAISVCQRDMTQEERWHVYRRYSDFHDFHQKVTEKFEDLSRLPFPGKKTFNNMDHRFLEKRKGFLNQYLQSLLQVDVLQAHSGLQDMVLKFLDHGAYERVRGHFARKLDTLVNPLKNSVRSVTDVVKSMPDNLINTVDGVMDGLSRVFHGRNLRNPSLYESMKVGAAIDIEDENIPLRIMLLLMDEVFDLKSRNQWLRRQIVTVLRQIIKAMFGDIVNRRILEYVASMTSPEQVAEYIKIFKQSLWPNGYPAKPSPIRDEPVKMRTRVAAKLALLSSLSDELKHIIGSETTRKGILCIFEMVQHPVLNKRLMYVLLEGILDTLFPDHNFPAIFRKLHCRSSRVRDDLKSSQRNKQDLRR